MTLKDMTTRLADKLLIGKGNKHRKFLKDIDMLIPSAI